MKWELDLRSEMRVGAPARGARTGESATRVAVRGESEGQVRIGTASAQARGRQPRGPAEERHYSWLQDHLGRLDGKEARSEYYARLAG
jgi:hypothetical protein